MGGYKLLNLLPLSFGILPLMLMTPLSIFGHTKLFFYVISFIVILFLSGQSEDYQSYVVLLTKDTSVLDLKEPIVHLFKSLGQVSTPYFALNLWSALNLILLILITDFLKLRSYEAILFLLIVFGMLVFQSSNQLRSSTAIALCTAVILSSINLNKKLLTIIVIGYLVHKIVFLYVPFLFFTLLSENFKKLAYVSGFAATPAIIAIVSYILENSNLVYKRYLLEGWLDSGFEFSPINAAYILIAAPLLLFKSVSPHAAISRDAILFCVVFKVYSMYATILGRIASLFELFFWLFFCVLLFEKIKQPNQKKIILLGSGLIMFLCSLYLSIIKENYAIISPCMFSSNESCRL